MALDGLSFPDLSRMAGNSEAELKQVKDYLYQLTEQLKYQLANIDEDNLSSSLVALIKSGADTSALGTSSVQQFVANLRLDVTNTEEQAVISLVSSGTTLDTKVIRFPQSSVTQHTLQASGWSAGRYALAIDGLPADSMLHILPALGITDAQLLQLQQADLQDGGQESGVAYLLAHGPAPTINIPIRVIVEGG